MMNRREKKMAQKQEKSDSLYYCQLCGVAYKEREWAEKCEVWCREHKGSCNLEIIEHAVNDGKKGCC